MRISQAVTKCSSFLLLGVLLVAISCGAAPEPDKTVYSNTSNKELKQKALRLVKSIRELVDSYNKKDRALMAEYDKKNKPEIRIDERKVMRDQWLKDSDAVHDSAMRSYKENYWADAILLRNELYRRLQRLPKELNQTTKKLNQTTKKLNQTNLAGIYQNPTNGLGVQVIADNLEQIAKPVPD